jgi:hypothetical protein
MMRLSAKRVSVFVLVFLAMMQSSPARGQTKLQADANNHDRLSAIAKSHQIEIVTAEPEFPIKLEKGEINGKKAAQKDLDHYAPIFVDEFNLYPPELIKCAKLKRVVLGVELSFAGQLRTAIPDYKHDTLYLDAVRGADDKTYVRKVIHHDFFHMIDKRDDGSVKKDERWAKLNPADFKYGTGGKNAQDMPSTSLLTDRFPGFLNHYSTTAIEEDKAEIFANMIVDPDHVDERSKKDPVVKAKAERMRELLKSFCPEIDDKFWTKARKAANR